MGKIVDLYRNLKLSDISTKPSMANPPLLHGGTQKQFKAKKFFDFQNGGKDLINSTDKENRTPLHYAASKGSLQVSQ